MKIKSDITSFIRKVEEYSNRKLNYPEEISELLQAVAGNELADEFNELIFYSKFIVRTHRLLNRIGADEEGYERLSDEFKSAVEKTMDIMNIIAEKSDKKRNKFISIAEKNGIDNMMDYYQDLAIIKNWQNDGKPLPHDMPFRRNLEET